MGLSGWWNTTLVQGILEHSMVTAGEIWAAVSFRSLTGIPSSPAALWGFSCLRSLVIPVRWTVMLTKVRCSLGPKSGNEESLLTDKDCLLKCCFLFWIAVFGFNQGPQSFVAAGIAANDVRYVLVVRLFAQSLCIFLDSVVFLGCSASPSCRPVLFYGTCVW